MNKEERTFSSLVRNFDFSGEAIDTSLRKLLGKVALPKEAQQIDRAMEDFAQRYYECNSMLIDHPDVVYAVAFSILLLHTDAHNKNVKHKMDKDTFIMRTKVVEGGEGVPHEILDVMYDNIVTSQFTYADTPVIAKRERSNTWFPKLSFSETLSPPVEDVSQQLEDFMPAENTFNYKHTLKSIPIMEIHMSMLKAPSISLSGVKSRHHNKHTTIRVTKAGLMERKYDLIGGGKKAPARGWRTFGVILSGSQIIFFADIPAFHTALIDRTIPTQPLRPVQIVSLAQAICIYDESYTKYPNVFRLITGDGQEFLLRTKDMDDWMLKINYVATIKTTLRQCAKQERPQKIQERIGEITRRMYDLVRLLDRDLQLRRNLMVLVPIQKHTRERLLFFAETTGKRIKHKRIELQRLACYREYLESELSLTSRSRRSSSLTISSTSSSSSIQEEECKSLKSEDDNAKVAPQLPPFTFPRSFMESLLSFHTTSKARRRSQSNPIPNTDRTRHRSGSDVSSFQADDDFSIVIINESELEGME